MICIACFADTGSLDWFALTVVLPEGGLWSDILFIGVDMLFGVELEGVLDAIDG